MKLKIGCFFAGKWKNSLVLLFAMVYAFLIVPVLAQDPARKDLKGFYQQNCVGCHGADGSAVGQDGKKLKGQDFTDQGWQQSTKDKKMVKTILKGKFFGLAMPKYEGELTEEEAQWIVTNIVRKSEKGQIIAPDGESLDNK